MRTPFVPKTGLGFPVATQTLGALGYVYSTAAQEQAARTKPVETPFAKFEKQFIGGGITTEAAYKKWASDYSKLYGDPKAAYNKIISGHRSTYGPTPWITAPLMARLQSRVIGGNIRVDVAMKQPENVALVRELVAAGMPKDRIAEMVTPKTSGIFKALDSAINGIVQALVVGGIGYGVAAAAGVIGQGAGAASSAGTAPASATVAAPAAAAPVTATGASTAAATTAATTTAGTAATATAGKAVAALGSAAVAAGKTALISAAQKELQKQLGKSEGGLPPPEDAFKPATAGASGTMATLAKFAPYIALGFGLFFALDQGKARPRKRRR